MTWRRVSPSEPCPICGKPDNCTVAESGGAVWCGRISEGSVKRNEGGQYLHILDTNERDVSWTYTDPGHKQKPKPVIDSKHIETFSQMAERFFRQDASEANSRVAHQRRVLSAKLGVSVESLVRLKYGWDGRVWTNPEKDAKGNIIGVATRTTEGRKLFIAGGKRGLIYAEDWDTRSGPVLIVEGGSDTAAGMDLGLSTIGRPSNLGGAEFLIEMLTDFPCDRDILVIAERDQKPDGKFPGRDGAIKTAEKLCAELNRRVGWSFPPDGMKDLRKWLSTVQGGRAEWLAGLQIEWVQPPPIIEATAPDFPEITVESWREQLATSGTEILEHPGAYLDASPTGAGKSHRDIQLVQLAGRSLIVTPSHDNCSEVEADMQDQGINAKAYPPRLTKDANPPCPRCQSEMGNVCRICEGQGWIERDQNCWNSDGEKAQDLGLPVVSTVCPACPHAKQCKSEGYLAGIREAAEAPIAIATHSRGEHGGIKDLSDGRDYVSIHEDAIGMLRPDIEFHEPDLAAASCVLEVLLNDPKWLDWFGSGDTETEREERGEIYDFVLHMLEAAKIVAEQVRFAQVTTPLNLPPTLPKPRGLEPVLFSVCRQNNARFTYQPIKALIAIASSGQVYQAGVLIREPFGTSNDQNHRGVSQQPAESGGNRLVL